VVFDKSPKMSTYLLAWAIGEFDFVQVCITTIDTFIHNYTAFIH
jgi:aminopeptidase N